MDAVTAMFFTMTATYPVAAGLGGGGICLVRDARGQVTEFDFLTGAARRGGAYAVPGAVRGFAEMHGCMARCPGSALWRRAKPMPPPAFRCRQALAVRLAAAQNVVRLDAALAAEFLDETGAPRAGRQRGRQYAAGRDLGRDPPERRGRILHGAVAARIVAYSAAQGGGISAGELAGHHGAAGPARSARHGRADRRICPARAPAPAPSPLP